MSRPGCHVDLAPITLLEAIRKSGKTWDKLALQYGVTNPDPPWKTSLNATCEALAVGGVLPALELRLTEDALVQTTYSEVAAPERQLLALAHTILSRRLLSEDDLARRIKTVRERLEV